MIKHSTINILGQSNENVDLKKGYDKTLKNIATVIEDLLRIVWKCTKIALIIYPICIYMFKVNNRNTKNQV